MLLEMVMKLNTLDAGLNPRQQKALDILLETYELKASTNGAIDYTGKDGRARLYQAAANFCGDGNPIITRHGDLRAAHLAINYNNTVVKLRDAQMPPISDQVDVLLKECADLSVFPVLTEERLGLFLSYYQKKKAT